MSITNGYLIFFSGTVKSLNTPATLPSSSPLSLSNGPISLFARPVNSLYSNKEPIAHSLLEYGEFTGLANDEILPLDNDNGDKEGSVAGVFKDFTVPEKKIKYTLVVNNE